MQRALRAGWPCAWPMISSRALFPREARFCGIPRAFRDLSCQGKRVLARVLIRHSPVRHSFAAPLRFLCHYVKGLRTDGGVMRVICVALFACLFGALVSAILPAQAAFECGTFDGKFTCRSSSGGAPQGKNAPPVP